MVNFMLSVVQLKHTMGYLRGFDGFLHDCVANPVLLSENKV